MARPYAPGSDCDGHHGRYGVENIAPAPSQGHERPRDTEGMMTIQQMENVIVALSERLN